MKRNNPNHRSAIRAIWPAAAVASLLGCALPGQPTADVGTELVEKLDLASFRNSTGPGREAGKHRFADYGFRVVGRSGSRTRLTTTNGDWVMGFDVLNVSDTSVTLCFFDVAHNGGTYRATTALLVKRDHSSLWKATEIKAGFPGCSSEAG